MKRTLCLIIILLSASCVSQKELALAPEVRPSLPERVEPVSAQIPQPAVTGPAVKYKSFLQCDEKTDGAFNSSGIEVLPFMRVAFFDMDGDGLTDMIAGSKDGSLRLYRNAGSLGAPRWILVPNYFKGVTAGAFSAPAAGDIDGDGKPEILLGTGGFSKDSGRVICYKNSGTLAKPVWEKMDLPEMRVGNDATPALFDVDRDGRADLIVGNSTGQLSLFRSVRKGNSFAFVKDTAYFKGVNIGMYAVPAVSSCQDRIVIVAGNSMGKLSILERGYDSRSSWQKSGLPMSFSSFASPAFIQSDRPGVSDLVISDGDGQLTYYKNTKKDYRDWKKTDDYFSGRTLTGAAAAPVIIELDGRSYMVVGNINGEIKLFVDDNTSSGLPWRELPGFFKGIKLSSFSRGLLTGWDGRFLLITGQQDGILRAFLNTGSMDKPSWSEKKQFFKGVPKISHASPFVFDIDNDGKWELLVGGSDGYVKGFRYVLGKDGNPVWSEIEKDFAYAKVDGFASPSLVREDGKTYLFVGRQDGKISVFTSDPKYWGNPVFYPDAYLEGIPACNHSCPAALEKNGHIEFTVGDYNGNLRHFACRREKREIKEN